MRQKHRGLIICLLAGVSAAVPAAFAQESTFFYRYRAGSVPEAGSGSPGPVTPPPGPTDSIPDSFTILTVTGAAPSTYIESAPVTVIGFTGAQPISATAVQVAEVSVEGGPWTTSTTITSGQSFRVRTMSSSTYESTSTVSVKVGDGDSVVWSVETRTQDATPDSFSIPSLGGKVLPQSTVYSSPVVVTGFDGPVPISVTNGEVSVENGAWTASTTIMPGQSFRLKQTAPLPQDFGTSSTVNVSGVTKNFFNQVLTFSSTPGNPTIGKRVSETPDGLQKLVGFDGSLPVVASGGAEVSVNGGAWTTSTSITSGQTIDVRATTGTPGTTQTYTISFGGYNMTWKVSWSNI